MEDSLNFVIIFSGIWGVIGIIFLTIGIGLTINRKKKKEHCTQTTTGKVLSNAREVNREREYDRKPTTTMTYYPVYEYYVEGNRVEKRSSYGSSSPRFYEGQEITICYNPENPNEHYIEGDLIGSVIGIIFTAVGAVSIIVAIGVAIAML